MTLPVYLLILTLIIGSFWVDWHPTLMMLFTQRISMWTKRFCARLPELWSHCILTMQIRPCRPFIFFTALSFVDKLFFLLHQIHATFSFKSSESARTIWSMSIMKATWYQWASRLLRKFLIINIQEVWKICIRHFWILFIFLFVTFCGHGYLCLYGVSSTKSHLGT